MVQPTAREPHRGTSEPHRGSSLVPLLVAAMLLAGCGGTQLVDASGERGGGGLAFLVMAVFFWTFIGSLFYMDRVRSRRERETDEPGSRR